MKKLMFILIVLFLATPCFAEYVVVDKYGIVVAKTDKVKNKTGHERRGETIYNLSEDLQNISIEDLRLKNNKIIERKYTEAEKNLKEYNEKYVQEELMITQRMRKIAVDSLEAEGYKFQFINVEE